MKLAMATTLLGLVTQATAVNITIADNAAGGGFGGGPRGQGNEDQETEPGTVQSQIWDMEAFTIVGSKLYIFGGYNLNTGDAATGYKPGDLFIKIGGSAPSGLPNTANSGNDVIPNNYVYNYAVILSGGLGSSAAVQSLNANSKLLAVEFDQFNSNPWTYSSDAVSTTSTATSYTAGLSDALVLGTYNVDLKGGAHNILEVDLAFLGAVASGTDVWFSYTMQCGNDSLKGQYGGGFRIPDAGATFMLLGLGLGTLAVVGRKLRAA